MSKNLKRVLAIIFVALAVVVSPQVAGDSAQPLPAAWLQTNDPGGGGGSCGGCGG